MLSFDISQAYNDQQVILEPLTQFGKFKMFASD